jgi:hypothetical protein
MHGTSKAKGCSHARLGNFCKMFPRLKTWAEDCGITEQCEAEAVARAIGGVGGLMHDVRNESPDSDIPAGYTFFAQFVDHDITLDTTSPLHGKVEEAEIPRLPNLRSASLDLDCVYGLGPEAQPFMFDPFQPGRMRVGSEVDGVSNPHDVPRNEDGAAMIGDPRNDENLFISQMQAMFLKFHNRRLVAANFEKAQEETRYHYQYVVLYDFLKRVCHPDIYNFALPLIEGNAMGKKKVKAYPFCDIRDKCHRICMPVEFSVGAFRFGHTMVRSFYPANADYPLIELFDERFGTLGFSQVPPQLNVDWRFQLDMEDCHPYAHSKALDELLADELIRLPDPVVGRNAATDDRALSFRNILRGHALGLASGQRIAAALEDKGYPINPNANLKFGDIANWSCLTANLPCDISKHTPLFFYLMREAAVLGNGQTLGPVGSALLMEVFGAMFVYCGTFLQKKWKPDPCLVKGKDLTLGDMARYAAG